MSITNFKEQFSDRYQDTFHKALVGRLFANYRLEPELRQGDTVHRFAVDMSAVKVRTITPLTDRTIDAVANTDETLVIDQYKGTTFPISEWEDTLHGNPDLGMLYGKEAGILVAEYVDATILGQVVNATFDFDAGDLTTGTSSGTPIDTGTTTNIPLMITRAKAKLQQRNKVRGGNRVWIVDDYTLANITGNVIGRDTEMGDSFYKNGASGSILGAEVLVSDNLTGEAVLSIATNVTAGDTITLNGVEMTARAVPSVAGEFDIGADADATRVIIANMINGSATGLNSATGYFEFSASDRAVLDSLRITATDSPSANTITIVAIGSGRLVLSETFTDATDTWSKNMVHCIYGQKGAVDFVMKKEVKMKMREEAKQDTMNVFNDAIFGVKTFADGKKRMLDVLVNANT